MALSAAITLRLSAPALAQTKPWWVTAIRTPWSARRTSRV